MSVKRGERRVWEVKTGEPHPVSRGDVNQLLGQFEVETKRAAKTRVYVACWPRPLPSRETPPRPPATRSR